MSIGQQTTMQQPLPNGTILQHRYRLVEVLGQGGFGRTYLAEDQGRFNEFCVLKEFTPQQTSAEGLRKAKELFQKEAEILYRIKHPQVPDFRATFEQAGRLFLVEQYVPGKTLRELLDDRTPQGFVFSEREGLQLLKQMLTVLKYLHDQNIVHRDISPDNIICRQPDNLPVLIDFGAVKELVTQLSQPSFHTRIGKDYYAAPEQMQTGRATRSSDLYSLAVTIVVLLTGQEPDKLYDSDTQTWYWQRWVQVSPPFATVLNRMLRYEPIDRYQSADEVLPLLPSLTALPIVTPQPANLPVTQPTVNMVGHSPRPIATHATHSAWSKLLISTGKVVGHATPRLAKFLWSAMRWMASTTVGLFGSVFSAILKWAIVLFVIVSLVRWGWASLVQQSKEWVPSIKVELPKIELPKIEIPPIKLPKINLPIELPTAEPPPSRSLSNQQRRENLKNRLIDLNVNSSCFTRLVDDRFYDQHPELVVDNQRVALSDSTEDEKLRAEWFTIADRLLKNPDRYADCELP